MVKADSTKAKVFLFKKEGIGRLTLSNEEIRVSWSEYTSLEKTQEGAIAAGYKEQV